MSARPAKRLLIVGWDAADWKIIDPLLLAGKLPHLRALIDSGLRADLASLEPRLSPLLWTSIATGKVADQHGILNFLEPDGRGGVRPVASTSRTCKALWNILTQSGLLANVVSWYATHPAEPIGGACISNLFQEGCPADPNAPWPLPPGAVHPPELGDEVAALRLHPRELYPQELMALLPRLSELHAADRRIPLLAKILAQCSSVHNVATALLSRDREWDCTMVFQEAIDVVGHHFMQYYPPRMAHVGERDFGLFSGVVPAMYELQDAMLGVLLGLAGPETTTILLSDHGFHSDHLRPPVPPNPEDEHAAMDASWHRRHGVLVMSGPGVRRGAPVYGAKLLDIAPTALTLLGLPSGADMQGRTLAEAVEAPAPLEQVFSWDAIEGEAGMHPADLRVDPFEATDALRQLADLGYVQGLGADAEANLALVRRETRFNRAIVYLSTGRLAQAAEEFAALHAEAPGEPRYWMNLAQALYAQQRLAEARAVLEGARARGPAVPDAQIMLGVILSAEGRTPEAIALLEAAERSYPDRGDIRIMLGRAYAAASRAADAERCYRAALGNDPSEPRAHLGLAQAALARGDFEGAAGHCLEAVRLQHFFPEAHYALGVALTWAKSYEYAVKAFEVAVSMEPGMIDAHRYLASIFRHLARPVDAGRHRQIAERLIADRSAGRSSLEHSLRQVPLGPQDWARAMGSDDAGD
jgi:predicted AlkP superfamily phosphohydrolase/phosphomutase/tetratricopeptide (TPR) repeat protein